MSTLAAPNVQLATMKNERAISAPPSTDSPASTTAAEPKPVKLRNACNQCFAAKVRCNGNKTGCERCLDRKLSCKYSESRVGKVVGKRRKRPLEDAVGTVTSSEWAIPKYIPPTAIPSPASTSTSDDGTRSSKLHKSSTTDVDTAILTEADVAPQPDAFCIPSGEAYAFLSRSASLAGSIGLPTPGLSPPQIGFCSPIMLENNINPVQPAPAPTGAPFLAPSIPVHPRRTPEPSSTDDEELLCIKLLGHLKRQKAKGNQSCDEIMELVRKSIAAVCRILKSKQAREDYACIMLLSTIMMRMVELCEHLCLRHFEEPGRPDVLFLPSLGEAFLNENDLPYLPMDRSLEPFRPDRRAAITEVLMEASDLAVAMGNSLKKKPLAGFQTIGRHESFLLDLSHRLKRAMDKFVVEL